MMEKIIVLVLATLLACQAIPVSEMEEATDGGPPRALTKDQPMLPDDDVISPDDDAMLPEDEVEADYNKENGCQMNPPDERNPGMFRCRCGGSQETGYKISSIPEGLSQCTVLTLESVEKLDGSGAVAEKVESLIIRSTSNGKVLEELTSRGLRKNFPNLKNLRVTCGLESLDLAKSFPSLESVDIMDYNRGEGERPLLKKIDFKRLTNLKTIRLKGCEKQWVRSWDFEHWDKLENFQLSRCQLESFDFSMSYPSLKRLDLDKTGISISENDVLDAPALTRLELENVDLSKIDLTKLLQKVKNLETVKFERNQLTTFPTEGLSFDKLKELEIRKQNLKALDLTKYNLANVDEMWIDKNPFESLKVPIAQMNKLEELEVKYTALKSYSLGSTKIPFALRELSVKKNRDLETLEVGALSTVYELNVKDNKNLKRITFANGIPVVNDEIDLKRNPKLECSCALVELLANVAPEGGRKKGIEIEGMCLNKDGKSVQVSDVSKENCVA